MSNLVDFAKNELKIIEDGCKDEEGLKYQKLIDENIINVIQAFSEGDHSGFSASYATNFIERLMRFLPITLLTGEDSEWTKLDYDSDVCYQNKRCSFIFKDSSGRAYNANGKAFSDDGKRSWFTNKDSRVYIEFPYNVPLKPNYIDLTDYEEREDIKKSIYERIVSLADESFEKLNPYSEFSEDDYLNNYILEDKIPALITRLNEIHNLVEGELTIRFDDHIYLIISKIQRADKIGSIRDVYRKVIFEDQEYGVVFNTGRKEIIEILKWYKDENNCSSTEKIFDIESEDEMSMEAFKVAQFADAEKIFEKEKNEPVLKITPKVEKDYIKTYNEFWKELVEDTDGTLNKDKIMRELSDYSMVIDNCTLAYMEMSSGNISKPNTKFFEVKSIFDANFLDKGITQDDVKDMIVQCEDINELKIALKDYFELDI